MHGVLKSVVSQASPTLGPMFGGGFKLFLSLVQVFH